MKDVRINWQLIVISLARKLSIAQLLIYAGAVVGPLVFVLVFLICNITLMWHAQDLAKLVVTVPLIAVMAGWMLLPYWGALRWVRQGAKTRGGSAIVIVAVILVSAMGAISYLKALALLEDKYHPTGGVVNLMIIIIPMVQWVVLGLAAMLVGLTARRGTQHSGEATITENNIGMELKEPKRFKRSRQEKMIAGICGGLAKYFKVDFTVIRGAFLLLTVLTCGFGALIYLIMWIIVPKESESAIL